MDCFIKSMKFITKPTDEDFTSMRITKKNRRMLGLLTNGNERLDMALDKALSPLVERLPEPNI